MGGSSGIQVRSLGNVLVEGLVDLCDVAILCAPSINRKTVIANEDISEEGPLYVSGETQTWKPISSCSRSTHLRQS
jgi:hypothetical protein